MAGLTSSFNDPQNSFNAVHIAGTNGKGSVAVKTAAALQMCGFKTGLFTSPHIDTFCERIKINNQMISEDQVVKHATQIFDLIDEKKMNVTFFEIVTMIAFLQFQKEKVDYAVLECGLGGELDATNIVSKVACCAVTSIGRDHQDILGYDLEDIAAEKAGIIKPGIGGCVLGPTTSEYKVFKDKYAESGCSEDRLKQVGKAGESHSYTELNKMMSKEIVALVLNESVEEVGQKVPDILLDRINPPCRMEWIRSRKLSDLGLQVVLDVCHNP